MKPETLKEVEDEARELLKRIKELRADEYSMKWLGISGTPKTSAVRRQSMELTRAFARLRR